MVKTGVNSACVHSVWTDSTGIDQIFICSTVCICARARCQPMKIWNECNVVVNVNLNLLLHRFLQLHSYLHIKKWYSIVHIYPLPTMLLLGYYRKHVHVPRAGYGHFYLPSSRRSLTTNYLSHCEPTVVRAARHVILRKTHRVTLTSWQSGIFCFPRLYLYGRYLSELINAVFLILVFVYLCDKPGTNPCTWQLRHWRIFWKSII